jgi:hypothetical protein
MVSAYKEKKMLRAAVLRLKKLPEDHAMRYLSSLFKANMIVAVKIGARLSLPDATQDELHELADIAVDECFSSGLNEETVEELVEMKKGA